MGTQFEIEYVDESLAKVWEHGDFSLVPTFKYISINTMDRHWGKTSLKDKCEDYIHDRAREVRAEMERINRRNTYYY
jgi:hypothetical protein